MFKKTYTTKGKVSMFYCNIIAVKNHDGYKIIKDRTGRLGEVIKTKKELLNLEEKVGIMYRIVTKYGDHIGYEGTEFGAIFKLNFRPPNYKQKKRR